MYLKLVLFATFLLATYSNAAVVGRDDVVIKDLRLFVDGEEFWLKSMCYQPTPLGREDMAPDETGGTGLCSERQTPFGDTSLPNPGAEYKSACYDSDYFDGSDLPYREPRGPVGGWFNALWERDLPVMVDLGVNTVRLYNTNPVTLQASIQQLGTGDIAFPLGKNHIPFMDYAEELGLKVIFPLMGDKTQLLNTPKKEYERLLMNQIEEIGNHSALVMYTLGNELGLIENDEDTGWDEDLILLINTYIVFARQYQMFKWGRNIPITVAEVDYPSSYENMVRGLDVDVFTSNAGYRGNGFSDLWTGNGRDFPGFLNLSCTYDIPLFIGEWGWESIENEQNYLQPDWFNEKFSDLVANTDNGCIGGSFFEFNDEPQKEAVTQQTMGVVNFTESECSRESNCWTPDILVEKDHIFDAVKEGTWDGKPYNYNGDVFELLGRPRMKLEDSTRPAVCSPYPQKPRDPIYPSSTEVTFATGRQTSELPDDPSSASSLVSSLVIVTFMIVFSLL